MPRETQVNMAPGVYPFSISRGQPLGRAPFSHHLKFQVLLAVVMAILPAVEAAVGRLPVSEQNGWKAQTALTLARTMDAEPNASIARELRSVMNDLEAGNIAETGDFLDELASRRESKSTG